MALPLGYAHYKMQLNTSVNTKSAHLLRGLGRDVGPMPAHPLSAAECKVCCLALMLSVYSEAIGMG
jgi:hypothetical protein